jgi:hypothetical protein
MISKIFSVNKLIIPFFAFFLICCNKDKYVEVFYEGDVILKTQKEVDEFGAKGYTDVSGSIKIERSSNEYLTSLAPLNSLRNIGGALIISETNISDLNGLNNLSSIGGNLFISYNKSLTNLDALMHLTYIGDRLGVWGNNSLLNLDGLRNLDSPINDLAIWSNDVLDNINGLAKLRRITDLYLDMNKKLKNIDVLENIKIEGWIKVGSNPQLINIEGFKNLTDINGSLSIYGNSSLTDLKGLRNLSFVKNNVSIGSNTSLLSLEGLNNLTSVEILWIENNPKLNTINALQKLVNISDKLYIYNTPITDLEGLSGVTSLGQFLIIGLCSELKNMDGLRNLSYIGTDFKIFNCNILENMNGLNKLSYVGNNLEITANISLNDYCGLQPLIEKGSINGAYKVYSNLYNPTQQDFINGNCKQN